MSAPVNSSIKAVVKSPIYSPVNPGFIISGILPGPSLGEILFNGVRLEYNGTPIIYGE